MLFRAGPAPVGERFVEVVLRVSCAGDASGRSSARELRGLLPSRGRAFTLPALMTSGVRLRIKEAQRLTLRSGEAVHAVTTWLVPPPASGWGIGEPVRAFDPDAGSPAGAEMRLAGWDEVMPAAARSVTGAVEGAREGACEVTGARRRRGRRSSRRSRRVCRLVSLRTPVRPAVRGRWPSGRGSLWPSAARP